MSTASRKDGALKVGKTAQKPLSWSLPIWRKKFALEEEGVFAACNTKRCVAKHLGVFLDLRHFDLPKSTSEKSFTFSTINAGMIKRPIYGGQCFPTMKSVDAVCRGGRLR